VTMESPARKILSPLRSEPRCALTSFGSANSNYAESPSARDISQIVYYPSDINNFA